MSGDELRQINVRFNAHMKRINLLRKHISTLGRNDSDADTATLVGDLYRMDIILIHAFFEDTVRSIRVGKKSSWTFSGKSDLNRALRKLGLDPKKFEDLYRAMALLAQWRTNIVHYADLRGKSELVPKVWNLGDSCKHLVCHLAVCSFVYRLIVNLGKPTLIELRMSSNFDKAFWAMRSVLKELSIALSLPSAELVEALSNVGNRLDAIQDSLEITVSMFIGADGKPLEGALRRPPDLQGADQG